VDGRDDEFRRRWNRKPDAKQAFLRQQFVSALILEERIFAVNVAPLGWSDAITPFGS
jgi:hypothetical protein